MEGLQTFFVAKGNSELKNESLRDDLTPYDYFEGDDMNTFADEFSDATGSMRRARRRLKRGRTHTKEGKAKGNMFQRFRDRRQKRRKAEAKREQDTLQDFKRAEIQDQKMIDDLQKENVLKSQTPMETPVNEGMNKTLKIVLIVGGIGVAVLLGVLAYKKFKK
jgi:hypothetical protein